MLVDGRLYLHVDDNQWLHELSYMRHDLLAKLRRACPTAGIKELRLRVGEVELVPPPEPVPEPPPETEPEARRRHRRAAAPTERYAVIPREP